MKQNKHDSIDIPADTLQRRVSELPRQKSRYKKGNMRRKTIKKIKASMNVRRGGLYTCLYGENLHEYLRSMSKVVYENVLSARAHF